MPRTRIVIYQEKNGTAPLLEWLDQLPHKVQDDLFARIDLLHEQGYDLRRPIADILGEGIYELRKKHMRVNYRILYGFVGKNIVLLSHGCTKKDKVPPREIKRAAGNLEKYKVNPLVHTHKEHKEG
jgi:phage-related protein